ncbi:hypothetical protein [Vibrio coralliilyticus]|uniref:hypothetical protein n=1 Tax=Vibrio coralliilyticus TaxID=190893 RepID=UPI001F3E0378|nr:hypothetical protein [Vibrio coralliilyticus]
MNHSIAKTLGGGLTHPLPIWVAIDARRSHDTARFSAIMRQWVGQRNGHSLTAALLG